MMQWRDIDWKLSQRTARERQIVFGGVAVAIPLLVWALIWQPLLDWRADEARRFEAKRQTLEWMHGAAAQIEAYRKAGRASGNRIAGSPEQVITRSAASLGLSVSRIEPSGDRRYNVFFTTADYKNFLRFVDQLQQQGLSIESLTMGQLPQPGQVSVRMTLESAA
ncbi:type II secretion system protein GspM [Litorivivens sp.]|uniref:type II secretion system protein GspM n=1 Tax=Litorivivens sp. TaxID=2020868 RepID=UPI00356A8C1D